MRAVPRVATPIALVVGTYSAFAAALLFVRANIDRLLALAQRVSPMPAMRMDIVAWRTEPLTQFRTYCIVLAVVALVAFAHAVALRALRGRSLAVVVVEAVVFVIACISAFRASSFLGAVFLCALVPTAALVAPFVLRVRRSEHAAPPESVRRRRFTAAIVLQSVPLAWGAWLTTFDRPRGAIVVAQVLVWGLSLWRAIRRRGREEDALAGLAFVPLPVVGLLRSPHWGWVVGAVALYGAIGAVLRANEAFASRVRRSSAEVADVVVVATSWSLCAILTTPYRFRDLPRLNHLSHESGQYASINSILHGKFMMADAGLIYGPLRSYVLALYMRFAGMTAEQTRLGQALMILGALAPMVWVGWRLVERRGVAMAWYLYLMLVGTYVLEWMHYSVILAFGWADLGRMGLPVFAAVGGVEALLAGTRAGTIDRLGARRLVGWGVAAAIATLWAQEFGICAIAVLFVVPAVHFLFVRGRRVDRARLAGTAIALYAVGIAGALGLYVGVYALYGRAGLFLHTVLAQSAAFASGSYGAIQFPVTESSFLSLKGMMAGARNRESTQGFALEYVIPPAIYALTLVALAARAVGRRWRERDTLTFGVLLFGIAAFRFALGRTDYNHMTASDFPAVILLVRLAVEAASAVYVSRAQTLALRSAAIGGCLLLAIGSLRLTGVPLALRPRLAGILAGFERPSSGKPYSYPTIPRAGDVLIQPEYVALVSAIQANTSPSDKIFQRIGYMDGGEVYFLADRANPTSFDVLAEFLTTERQHTAFLQVVADPPKLAIGEDSGMVGPELNQYLKEHYHLIGTIGGFKVSVRND
ncbi:MAG: hypothetical protein ACLQVI_18720 [Polyangiaceae bacterium]